MIEESRKRANQIVESKQEIKDMMDSYSVSKPGEWIQVRKKTLQVIWPNFTHEVSKAVIELDREFEEL